MCLEEVQGHDRNLPEDEQGATDTHTIRNTQLSKKTGSRRDIHIKIYRKLRIKSPNLASPLPKKTALKHLKTAKG